MWDPGWLTGWAEGGVLARGPSLSGLSTHRTLSYALPELSTVWREVALRWKPKRTFNQVDPAAEERWRASLQVSCSYSWQQLPLLFSAADSPGSKALWRRLAQSSQPHSPANLP